MKRPAPSPEKTRENSFTPDSTNIKATSHHRSRRLVLRTSVLRKGTNRYRHRIMYRNHRW
ncbi:hypothetical protein D3C71_1842940 [compost metagenome]